MFEYILCFSCTIIEYLNIFYVFAELLQNAFAMINIHLNKILIYELNNHQDILHDFKIKLNSGLCRIFMHVFDCLRYVYLIICNIHPYRIDGRVPRKFIKLKKTYKHVKYKKFESRNFFTYTTIILLTILVYKYILF